MFLKSWFAAIPLFTVLVAVRAEIINVPNASFESPQTSFVDINIDFWQKSAKPDWYVESGGFLWSQLTGVFRNTPTNSSDHIDNCDGDQALWLFAVPEVALFQDYNSVDWNDPVPLHAFDAKFQPGIAYELTVGVIGSGGGMLEGATLELSLYCRDGSNMVTVGRTSLTNTPTIFSNNTHLVDCKVHVPVVRTNDAWAGQNIGIQFLSTVSSNLQGGYWDLDNVRLAAIAPRLLLNPVWANNQFQFTIQSEPGFIFEILASTNVALPVSDWTSLGIVTNTTGLVSFTDPIANAQRRFYQTRYRP